MHVERPSTAVALRVELRPSVFVARSMRDSAARGLALTVGMVAGATLLPAWGVGVGALVGGGVASALSDVGIRRLRRARRELEEDETSQAAADSLRALSASRWCSVPVRVDAWGYLSLERLEAGDLEGALAMVGRIAGASSVQTRRRTLDAGFFGEAVVGVLGRLFPESKIDVPRARAFRPPADGGVESMRPRLEWMLAILRALEAVGVDDRARALGAFNELPREALTRAYPTLACLVQATLAQVEPSLGAGLGDALEALGPAQQQTVFRRYPKLRATVGAAYRKEAALAETSDALVPTTAPGALQAVRPAARVSRLLPIAPKPARIASGMAVVGFSLLIVISSLGVGTIYSALVIALSMPVLLSASLHRRSRVSPLRSAGIDDSVWLREIARSRTRASPQAGEMSELHPFRRGELMLMIGVHRAEQALARGDLDEAREQIGWWMGTATDRTLLEVDMLGLGSALLRLATLLGYATLAERLASHVMLVMTESRPLRGDRSGRGDAPQAIVLATALHLASRGRISKARSRLRSATKLRRVALNDFERGLYGELVRRVEPQPVGVLVELVETPPPAWISAVWPRGTLEGG